MNFVTSAKALLHLRMPRVLKKRALFPLEGSRFKSGYVLRAVLYTAVLVTGTAVLMAVAGWQVVQAFEQSNANARFAYGERAFTYRMEETGVALEAWAKWLSEHPVVRAEASGQRQAQFVPTIEPLLSLWDVDFIGLVGRSGHVQIVPAALTDTAIASDEGLRWSPDALAQEGLVGLVLGRDGVLQWRAVVPIGNPGSPQGHVLVGYILGPGFADRFKAAMGTDISIYTQDRLISTSLSARRGGNLSGPPRGAMLEAGGGERGEFQIDGQSYRLHYFPLFDHSGSLIGSYSLSVPTTLLRDQMGQLLRELFLFVLKIIVIASGAAYVLMFRVVRPLRTLTDAVTRMGGGDLTTPVEVTFQDEAGHLAQQLEEMRRRLHQSLNELAIEKSLYQGIFQSMADGVFTTDATGNITSANPRAQALLHDAASLNKGWGCCVGFTLSDSAGQLLCDRVCLHSLKEGLDNAAVSKAQLQGPGDDLLDVEVTVSAIQDQEGNQIGLVHVLRDVSAQAELQRMKQRFLLSVAHELRTPLSSLSASVAILQEDGVVMAAEDRERMLVMIGRSTVRLQHLITNLLDLGSIEAGRFVVQVQPMDLAVVVQEAVGLCEPLLALKRQRVAVSLPTDCPRVSADSRRITQVLVNLLSNCTKYGPEDDEVSIEVHRSGGFVYVSVTDHGRGIDPAEAEHIFEYFYQASRRKGQESQGFGLGLAIANGIVEAHGGETGAESIPGRGTTIWFSLPIAATPARRADASQVLAGSSAALD